MRPFFIFFLAVGCSPPSWVGCLFFLFLFLGFLSPFSFSFLIIQMP